MVTGDNGDNARRVRYVMAVCWFLRTGCIRGSANSSYHRFRRDDPV